MFAYLLSLLFLGFLVMDYVSFYKISPRSWKLMAFVFSFGILASFHSDWVQKLSDFLGVWRASDLLIYISTVILIRELFISRIRQKEMSESLTQFIRFWALSHSQKVEPFHTEEKSVDSK